MTTAFTRFEGLGASPISENSTERASLWDIWPEREKDWYPLATVACANGHLATIDPKIHSVSADGTLSPSYVCPHEGCTFHEFVRFEGWMGAPVMAGGVQ